MRRRNRNIEIFSMSVLDMFASALGAFILCAIILFPYYRKDSTQAAVVTDRMLEQTAEELKQANGTLMALQAQVHEQEQNVRQAAESESTLHQCRKSMQDCRALLAKTFLLVQIDWQEAVGIDLQIADARGNAFTWFKTNRTGRDFPNSKAFLSVVVQSGPGIAYWVDPSAAPGIYQIDYTTQHPPNRNVEVKGFVFSHAGKLALPTRALASGQSRVHAGSIVIADDGGVTLR